MNVSVKSVETHKADGSVVIKKILIVNQDFKAGDKIYKESPVVAVLDLDLEGEGTHCSYCLRHIDEGLAIKPDSDLLGSVYCSKDCQVKAKAQSQNILFGSEPPLPAEMIPDSVQESSEERTKAQTAFAESIKQSGKSVPLLVARFVGRQVESELAKMASKPSEDADVKLSDGGDYTLNDHLERLRYLELSDTEDQTKHLREVLSAALPGLEQFITDERQAMLLGKMAYNAYGVCFAGGRDDKPASAERPEDAERSRTPYGTSRQIGSALYVVSSYAQHSCEPSARPSFASGTSELHLIASRDLTAGDEITVAYVDVAQHEGESVAETRRRRRFELARGWRFACTCDRCAKEAEVSEVDDLPVKADESKLEENVQRLDEQGGVVPGAAESSLNVD
ncbi:hypothetical protein EVG20_g84 [Dentipellis fragilis]|uniref:SET domain-containing protein n=1 Tax=Dentipellis fragilis TaxID=205917 RepID=A0A4Y9ZEK3_9AGAM|nr:hypothetical protein EVG20_g84 [Dentipellis fragilis]